MSDQEDLAIRQRSIQRGRAINEKTRQVPNRTKVVRLIVVPTTVNPADARQVRPFAGARHATRADVFCVKTSKGIWVPMTWLGDELVDHHAAIDRHPEVVVVLIVEDREQIQWQCDVDFWVSRIVPTQHPEFPRLGNSPAMPFRGNLINEMGAPGRPIVSGPPEWSAAHQGYNQLYKASFKLKIAGEKDIVDIDPDLYCDWN